MADSTSSNGWRPKANPWAIAASVALAAFMEVLDTSIANVALPYIAGGLGASQDQSTWILTSYLTSNAVVLPLGGWASSVFGRKKFFMGCIILFTVSSFLCGIAPSLGFLLLFRVIQGAGGGGLQPMADAFEPSKRGLAFSLYGVVAVLAPSIGPTIGGWLTDNYSWHWIFYINIPVGLIALVLVYRLVEDPPYIKPDRANFFKVDYIGLALLTLAMGGLQVFLDKGEENDWFASHFEVFFFALFLGTLIPLIWWEWKGAKQPIIDMSLFKFKNFAICFMLMLITGGILNASTQLEPQFLQQNLGYTATLAGLALSVGGVVLLFLMPLAGQALSRFPAKYLIIFGFALYAAGFFYSAQKTNLGMSFGFASWLRVTQVIAIPFVFVSVTTAAYFNLPQEKNDQVAGLINFARNVGGSVLISLCNAFITENAQFHQVTLLHYLSPASHVFQQRVSQIASDLARQLGPAVAQYAAQSQIYNQLLKQTQTLGYVDLYYVLAALSVLAMLATVILDKNKPDKGGGGAAMG